MNVTWKDDEHAVLRATDEVSEDVFAILMFHDQTAIWSISMSMRPERFIEVDEDRRLAFVEERQRIARLPDSTREPLVAEWLGRVRMFRDETRDLALLGAKLTFRRWLSRDVNDSALPDL